MITTLWHLNGFYYSEMSLEVLYLNYLFSAVVSILCFLFKVIFIVMGSGIIINIVVQFCNWNTVKSNKKPMPSARLSKFLKSSRKVKNNSYLFIKNVSL